MTIKNRFQTLKAIAFVTYKEWAAYRSHSMVSIFVAPVFFMVQYFIWKAIYASHDTLNGMTLEQILSYYGMSMILNFLIMDFADWNLQMLVRTGRYITFILRPMNHRFFALSQKVGHRVLGFFVEVIPVYLIFLFVFRINLVPANIGWFLLSTAFSFLIMFYMNYSLGLVGFWFVKTEGLSRIFRMARDFFSGVFIPLNFLPLAFQKATFFLPFQYVTYVPVRVFLGSYELGNMSLSIPQIVLIQGAMVLVTFGISEVLQRLGIRKYTGVGV